MFRRLASVHSVYCRSFQPTRNKSIFSKFVESLRQEASKNPEFNENVKIVADKLTEIQSATAVQATKKALQKAKSGMQKGNAALNETAKVVGERVSSISFVKRLGEKRSRRKKYRPKSKNSNEEEGSSRVIQNLSEKLEGLQSNFVDEISSYQYGGIRSKHYREKRKREKLLEHEKMQASLPKIEVNPDAGTNIQLHKDSAWKVKWNNFKDNNPVFQSIFELKKVYNESNNIFVHFAREITSSLSEKFSSVFEETETAKTIKKICEKNPEFTQEKFIKEAREFIVPEVLEALLSRDLKTLEVWCSEGIFSLLKAKFDSEAREFAEIVDSKILDLRHFELLNAKLLDDQHPVMVISFNEQHLITYKVKEAATDGSQLKNDNQQDDEFYCEDKIENLFHVWALVKDMDGDNPITGGWKVMEMATRNQW